METAATHFPLTPSWWRSRGIPSPLERTNCSGIRILNTNIVLDFSALIISCLASLLMLQRWADIIHSDKRSRCRCRCRVRSAYIVHVPISGTTTALAARGRGLIFWVSRNPHRLLSQEGIRKSILHSPSLSALVSLPYYVGNRERESFVCPHPPAETAPPAEPHPRKWVIAGTSWPELSDASRAFCALMILKDFYP
jgi:hypothetical protein